MNNIYHRLRLSYRFIITGFLLLIVSLILFANTRDQLGDVNNDGIVNVLDIVRIVNIILGNDPPPTDYELWAGDVNADETVNVQDIVIIVTIIMHTYECPDLYSPCSDNLSLCCMDTTSHQFSWTIDTLGNNGSYINDVEIVNENDIWVVGEFVTDSGAYNGARWNGEEWEFKGIYSNTAELYSIKYFDLNDIWVTTSGFPIHWDGTEWTLYHLQNMGINVSAGFGIWGTSSSNMYFVGYQGSIVHYDGENFEQMESGTDINLQYISGTPDGEHMFFTGYNLVDGARSIALEYEDGGWDTLYYSQSYLPDSDSEGMVLGNYVLADTVYFTTVEAIWKYNYLTGESTIVPGDVFGMDLYAFSQIIVVNHNDIFAKDGGYSLLHFNGQSWNINTSVNEYLGWFGLYGGREAFDVEDGLLVMVGCYDCWYGRGVVVRSVRD